MASLTSPYQVFPKRCGLSFTPHRLPFQQSKCQLSRQKVSTARFERQNRRSDLHVFELVVIASLTAMLASDPLSRPRVDSLVAGDSPCGAVVLDQDVEAFSIA